MNDGDAGAWKRSSCYELFTFSLSFFTILSLSLILSSKPYFTHLCLAPLLAFPSFPSYMPSPHFISIFTFPLSYINPVDYACKNLVYSLIATTVEDSDPLEHRLD